jgi:hypothetical protein
LSHGQDDTESIGLVSPFNIPAVNVAWHLDTAHQNITIKDLFRRFWIGLAGSGCRTDASLSRKTG